MSTIETILFRAMSEPTFAEQLMSSPEKALAGYNLSVEEVAKFKSMSRADFAALAPEERKSFGIKVHDGPDVNHNQSALSVRK